MAVHRATYVACDQCGTAAQIVTDSASEARKAARGEGFGRVKFDGRLKGGSPIGSPSHWEDRCVMCNPTPCRSCGVPEMNHWFSYVLRGDCSDAPIDHGENR